MRTLYKTWISFLVALCLTLTVMSLGYSQTCPADFSVCANEPSFALTGALPAGGVYSGAGVSGGNFDPASITAGVKTITYSYTDNGQPKSCSFNITVNPAPEVICAMGVLPECMQTEVEVLDNKNGTCFGFFMNVDPITTTWSGPGIGGNAVQGFTLNHRSAGTGIHSYAGVATSAEGCSVTFTSERWFSESPEVECILGVLPMCINEPVINFSDNFPAGTCFANMPSGTSLQFTWSGPGISGDLASGYTFDPAVAGAGMHQLTATATDGACPVTFISEVAVDGLPVISCPANMEVAVTDAPFALTGGTGGWRYYGPGVDSNTGMFDPAVAGEGAHNIQYGYPDVCGEEVFCSFIIKTNPLPVTLTKFEAKTQENKINLQWQTTEETKFDRFELERSISPKKGFFKIHELNGSNTANNYAFTDETAQQGIPQYYRLKMVDKDGTFAYSKITWALIDGSEMLKVYPNPVTDVLTLQSKTELTELRLFNTSGTEVIVEKLDGITSKSLNLQSMQPGTYLLQSKNVKGDLLYSRVLVE